MKRKYEPRTKNSGLIGALLGFGLSIPLILLVGYIIAITTIDYFPEDAGALYIYILLIAPVIPFVGSFVGYRLCTGREIW